MKYKLLFKQLNNSNFEPFSLTHKVGTLRCGHLSLQSISEICFRDNIDKDASIALEVYENIFVTKELSNKIHSIIEELRTNIVFCCENIPIARFTFDNANTEYKPIEINANIVRYLWDVLDYQGRVINTFADAFAKKISDYSLSQFPNTTFINPNNVLLGENVKIGANVVLDATFGYILIDDNATIQHNSVIMGPCYIGKNTIIKIGSKIYENCAFGEHCKIGGEVENSVFHNYSNKQHDGFIGHSYIGEWVNLGAGTSCSDLKNNYSNIKIKNANIEIDTGRMFLGVLIGDHTKTAINTSFTTGTIVGVCSMLAKSGYLPKYIPSFSWLTDDTQHSQYNIDKAIDTARKVMARRHKELSKEQEILLRSVL